MVNKKDEDWSFKVNSQETEMGQSKDQNREERRKRLNSKVSIDDVKKKEVDLSLDFNKVPERVSRSNAESYVNRDSYSAGKGVDTTLASYGQRAQASTIDFILNSRI